MGNGKFINGKLNFIVSFEGNFTPAAKATLKTQLQNASELLFKATTGQVEFGNIFLVDQGFGKLDSELIVIDVQGAQSGGTKGLFGKPNQFARLNRNNANGPSQIEDPSVVIHEMAHHIWNLGEEYAGPMESFLINKISPSPDRRTIPVIQPGVTANSLNGDRILLQFNNAIVAHEGIVVSNDATKIIVNQDFPDLPTNCTAAFGFIQDLSITCNPDPQTCIMGARGKTLFCGANHSNTATDQQVLHGVSCSDKIIATPGFGNLVLPFTAPPAAPSQVNFIDLEKQGRFAVVFDISGSMAGEKLEYTKQGVKYWIDVLANTDNHLCLIAYNSRNNVLLPLTNMSSPINVQQLKDDIDALLANGQTNIRDAITEGSDQIISIANRSVTQAILVLTDGKHNRPAGTSLLESSPSLISNKTRAVTVAIGEPDDVNFEDLDDLALATNGLSYLVGFSNPVDIETALAEANLFLTGNIVDSDFSDFVLSPPQKKYAPALKSLYKNKKNPSLKEVCTVLQQPLKLIGKEWKLPYKDQLFTTKDVYIEKGCKQVNFTINYRTDADIDIFLIDPSNQHVDITKPGIRKISDSVSHKIIVVNRPKPGNWKIILLAKKLSTVAPKTTVNITVGVTNTQISVWGSATKSNFKKGQPVKLIANAQFGSFPLTGLKVKVRLLSSDGTVTEANLTDGKVLTAESGKYHVDLPNLKKGKYKGVIHIEAPVTTLRADSLHYVMHHPSNKNAYDFSVKTGKFKRAIPFYFQKS